MPADIKTLMEKIASLPPERIAEIEDFVDFLRLREQERAPTAAPALAAIWDNPDGEAYDPL